NLVHRAAGLLVDRARVASAAGAVVVVSAARARRDENRDRTAPDPARRISQVALLFPTRRDRTERSSRRTHGARPLSTHGATSLVTGPGRRSFRCVWRRFAFSVFYARRAIGSRPVGKWGIHHLHDGGTMVVIDFHPMAFLFDERGVRPR